MNDIIMKERMSHDLVIVLSWKSEWAVKSSHKDFPFGISIKLWQQDSDTSIVLDTTHHTFDHTSHNPQSHHQERENTKSNQIKPIKPQTSHEDTGTGGKPRDEWIQQHKRAPFLLERSYQRKNQT